MRKPIRRNEGEKKKEKSVRSDDGSMCERDVYVCDRERGGGRVV